MPDIPTLNQPLFQQVLDQIKFQPDTHYQGTWERHHRPWDASDFCGTTRCVAGWANHFATGKATHTTEGILDAWSTFETAKNNLGLTQAEATQLFLESDDKQAVRLVERYALKGRENA